MVPNPTGSRYPHCVDSISRKWQYSPAVVRVAPFAIFLALTFCQGMFGDGGRYWFYVIKTAVGACLVWNMRPLVSELRFTFSWEAILTGVAIFVIWVGLDGHYPKLGQPGAPWNPFKYFVGNSSLAWAIVLVRLVGASLVVPPLEEVFYRSFLYRYLIKADFLAVPLSQFRGLPFLIASVVFAFEHHEWLAGLLCGFAFQGLVCWKGRLSDAIAAHALTNCLLGLWVIWKGAWGFW
jgi:CAAX prenyl protease-like protein